MILPDVRDRVGAGSDAFHRTGGPGRHRRDAGQGAEPGWPSALWWDYLIGVAATAILILVLSLFHANYTDPTTGQDYRGPVIDLGGQPLRFLLTFGLFLALCNALLRPVFLLLTGRWLDQIAGTAPRGDRRGCHLDRRLARSRAT